MDKKADIRDIAKMANVSIATVYRAFKNGSSINSKKKAEILAFSKEFGYHASKVAAGLQRKNINIGVICVDLISEYTKEIKRGFAYAYSELADFKLTYDIVDMKPITLSDQPLKLESEYIEVLDRMRKDGYHGVIIVSEVYTKKISDKINELVDAGIPVVTLSEDAPSSRRTFSISNNNLVAGKMAAQLLNLFMKGRNVVVFSGSLQSDIHKDKISGFYENSKKYGIEVLKVYNTEDKYEKADLDIRQAMEEFPDINGIYITSANYSAICSFLQKVTKPGDIKVISSDLFPQICEYIRSGLISATIYQNIFKQAKTAMEYIFYHLTENKKYPKKVMTIPEIVIESNLEQFL